MAARKQSQKAVEVDGVKVVVNTEFIRSWDGVRLTSEMRRLSADESAGEGEKVAAMMEYFTEAVPNVDEVVESLGGGAVADFGEVVNLLVRAIGGVTPKN